MASLKKKLNFEAIRKLAEKKAAQHPLPPAGSQDRQALLEQLHVHQIELELQNEELQRAHHEVEQVKRQYQELFAQAPVGYLLVDGSGFILKANQTFAALVGKKNATIVNTPLNDYLTPASQSVFLGTYKAFYKNPENKTLELQFHSNGKTCRFHGIKGQITSALEKAHLRLAVIDISLQKKAEEELRQAQKLESIGVLAGGIAHDFNNLLSPIIGYSELLLEDASPDSSQCESISEILKAGKKAKKLVRQLLAFSRKQTLIFEQLDANTAITDIYKILRRLIRENIDIKLDLATEPQYIEGDIGQFDQMLINLTVNAQDAMTGSGRVTLSTESLTTAAPLIQQGLSIPEGTYVLLKVRDDGCGIPEHDLPKIFDPFFTTKKVGEGTGMGLATVYGITKQFKGYIWAESKIGQGTVFNILLPRVTSAHRQTETKRMKTPIITGSSCKKSSIVIVEDDNAVRKMIARVLNHHGYTVMDFKSSAACLAAVEKQHLQMDILITDIIMPELDGKKLCRLLSPYIPDLKVIFMSGYNDQAHSMCAEMDTERQQFIRKPFPMNELLTLLEMQ